MKTEMGEYLVGAYLKLIVNCDVVDYNVRIPGGGLEGLGEMDVIGLRFSDKTAFLCEVTTHLGGLQIKDAKHTIKKILQKHQRQISYATTYLTDFEKHEFMLWSPYVSRGKKLKSLEEISTLKLIVNSSYRNAISELQEVAKQTTKDTNNPFFRALQILHHARNF